MTNEDNPDEIEALRKVDRVSLAREIERLTDRAGLIVKVLYEDREAALAGLATREPGRTIGNLRAVGRDLEDLETEAAMRKAVKMPLTLGVSTDSDGDGGTVWSLAFTIAGQRFSLSRDNDEVEIEEIIGGACSDDHCRRVFRELSGILTALDAGAMSDALYSGNQDVDDEARDKICNELWRFVELATLHAEDRGNTRDPLVVLPLPGAMFGPAPQATVLAP